MKTKLLVLAMLTLPALFAPGGVKTVARDQGTRRAVTKTGSKIISSNDSRVGWCVRAESGNTDKLRITLGNLAAPTVGMLLNPGDSYCEPIGGEQPYVGDVYAAAVTTAGTVNLDTLDK